MGSQKIIGFDARLYGPEHAGIGRYIINLLHRLLEKDKTNRYRIFLTAKYHQSLDLPSNAEKILADIRHYSLKEQLIFPQILKKYPCDLYHFPHFNVPYLFNRPFVVTIHDILWHQVKGLTVTTLNPLTYSIKYLGYRLTVNHAVMKAQAILTPSQWVKKQLLAHYPKLNQHNISVTYEGVESSFQKTSTSSRIIKDLALVGKPFFIYTGSAYPHKNISTLIDSLKIVNQTSSQPIHLVIVSARSVFLHKLKHYVTKQNLSDLVKFAGFVSDTNLSHLYRQAIALVHPSRSEGFGLTGLEAMAAGLPVISSQSAALPEIYQKAALYFDAQDSHQLAQLMSQVLQDTQLRQDMVKKGIQHQQFFTWDNTAAKTLMVYRRVINSLP